MVHCLVVVGAIAVNGRRKLLLRLSVLGRSLLQSLRFSIELIEAWVNIIEVLGFQSRSRLGVHDVTRVFSNRPPDGKSV